MGVITGTSGGVMRDVVVNEMPDHEGHADRADGDEVLPVRPPVERAAVEEHVAHRAAAASSSVRTSSPLSWGSSMSPQWARSTMTLPRDRGYFDRIMAT